MCMCCVSRVSADCEVMLPESSTSQQDICVDVCVQACFCMCCVCMYMYYVVYVCVCMCVSADCAVTPAQDTLPDSSSSQ